MKKEKYVMPQAIEEAFVVNSYVARCHSYTQSKGNEFSCINPRHSNYGEVIGSVFVDADISTCTMKVDHSTINTQVIWGNNYQPKKNAIVYTSDGTSLTCTERYNWWYIPSSNECYGSYINNGQFDEIIGNFS